MTSKIPEGFEDSDITASRALVYVYDHLCHGGSCVATLCDCGLTHFTTAPGHGDYEEGEADSYREAGHIEWTHFDTIHTVHLGLGGSRVIGCRCGFLEKFGQILLDNARDVTKLLAAYWADELKEADRLKAEAEGNVQILKREDSDE